MFSNEKLGFEQVLGCDVIKRTC